MRTCFAVVLVFLCLVLRANPVNAQATVSGLVLDESGEIRKNVPVRLTNTKDKSWFVVLSGADGTYAFKPVPVADYTVEVMGDWYSLPGYPVNVTGPGTFTRNIIGRAGARWISLIVGICILLYGMAVLSFRHHNIVATNRELLQAQLENIATRIPLESDPDRRSEANELKERVNQIWQSVLKDLTWREWFFWSRGREIASWKRLHEVERQLVAFMVPEARVIERAVTAEVDLRGLNDPTAPALADRMRATTQAAVASDPVDPHLLEHLKHQLAEGLTLIYGHSDTKFATLMEWHNKAMWLVYVALLMIAAVGLVFHHEELFLLGAAGGLMSRLTRTMFREDVPSDYGASWTTLFLSPLLGAISAWFGIALIMWLTAMGVLGDKMFALINWDRGVDVLLIGTAFALGFSERLFMSLLSAVEGRVTTALTTKPVPSPPTPGLPGGAALVPAGAGTSGSSAAKAALTTTARILKELDLKPGERAAFIGNAASPVRVQMAELLGVDQVFDATPDTLGLKAPLDGVLFEGSLTVPAFTQAAAQLRSAMRPDGRLVIVSQTPAAMFDADAASQRTQNHVGPALALELLTTAAGLSAQEPPVQLSSGADPVDWLAAFVKPVPGGSDR